MVPWSSDHGARGYTGRRGIVCHAVHPAAGDAMSKKIHVTWHIEDVIYRGKERGITITEEEAIDILDTLKDNHDSTIGINWDVIDAVTDFRLAAP